MGFIHSHTHTHTHITIYRYSYVYMWNITDCIYVLAIFVSDN